MIQRKQTIFLFLALVAVIACLCLPIGYFEQAKMGKDLMMSNLMLSGNQTNPDIVKAVFGENMVFPLFVTLLICCPLTILTIFKFKNRKLQARLCVLNIWLMIIWYALYAAYIFIWQPEGTTMFHITFAAILPFIAIIFFILARKGILADEKLVRSMDRIR